MKPGRAFEIFVKNILIHVGFSEVYSDGLYVFKGAPGTMIQGLGEAHNADVLLEPPAQTPFFTPTRVLIECKDYTKKVGLNTIRSALGLREDINHFEMVDKNELIARRSQRRSGIVGGHKRYSYQVAVAAMEGYTIQAQKFAATHRIPLIEFNKMPFWNDLKKEIDNVVSNNGLSEKQQENKISEFAEKIGKRMAVAITNSGQMLFLSGKDDEITFEDEYNLYWSRQERSWTLISGKSVYSFQLPDSIMEQWLNDEIDDLEMKKQAEQEKQAVHREEIFLSGMIVYYRKNHRPTVKMISINEYELKKARKSLL